MNDRELPESDFTHASREDVLSALFANMVIQQTNMALMLLGKMPHPETGQVIQDLDAAKMFIDQLEMLEVKTKGNLDKREERLLKESLTALRMAFVEAVDAKPESGPPRQTNEAAPSSARDTAAPPPATSEPVSSPATGPEESPKKFTKKY